MKFKNTFLVLTILVLFCLPVSAESLKDNILKSLDDVKNTIQLSKNKLLTPFIDEVNFISEDIDAATSHSEEDCASEVDDITSRIDDLVSSIERKECKRSKNKKSKCVSVAIANNLISKINDINDALNSVSNTNEVFDICISSDSTGSSTTTSESNSSGSLTSGQNPTPIETPTSSPTTSSSDVMSCNQDDALDLVSMLTGEQLTLSLKSKINLVAGTNNLDFGSIEFYKDSLNTGDIYAIKNTSYVPIEAMVSVDESTNTSSYVSPLISLLPRSQQPGFKVCTVDSSAPWSYKYSFTAKQGFSTSVYNGDGKYLLPYKPGGSFVVGQGEMGTFSHFGEFLYSIDFFMPEGTEVTAMRDGTVVAIKEDSNVGGSELTFTNDGNFILILHDDDSIGKYVHLKQNGAIVNIGDKVKAGDVIGLSGNTGRSTQPHLHVQVVLPKGFLGVDPIPIRFKCIDGALVEGQAYTATSLCR